MKLKSDFIIFSKNGAMHTISCFGFSLPSLTRSTQIPYFRLTNLLVLVFFQGSFSGNVPAIGFCILFSSIENVSKSLFISSSLHYCSSLDPQELHFCCHTFPPYCPRFTTAQQHRKYRSLTELHLRFVWASANNSWSTVQHWGRRSRYKRYTTIVSKDNKTNNDVERL